ncbi:MAG: chitobiase/beta-hexosaminidase C-terminal domain-containing protein [Oscillospiraceae bacterium]|nr:chitobiase/beta-hexosaminidase C-terminal domain-containing protein [Oscillospiraceae bacterium]
MKTQKCISIALTALLTAASFMPQTALSFLSADIISAEESAEVTAEEREIGFSVPSGCYDSEMKVELSSKSGRTIVYTTDGSDPTKSSTAQVYSSAVTVTDRTNEPNKWSLYEENENSDQSVSRQTGYKKPTYNVEKVTVIRAAVKNQDGTYGKVESETYIIKNGVLKQFDDIMVVSLVTDPDNLFSPDTGIYVTGKQYLDWRKSAQFDPKKSVWDTDNISNFFSKGKEWEREATFTVFRNGEEVIHQNVGIRIKGASTRNTPQKSFNIYAKSKYGPAKLEYPLIDGNTKISGKLIDKYDSVCLRAVGEDTRLRDG